LAKVSSNLNCGASICQIRSGRWPNDGESSRGFSSTPWRSAIRLDTAIEATR